MDSIYLQADNHEVLALLLEVDVAEIFTDLVFVDGIGAERGLDRVRESSENADTNSFLGGIVLVLRIGEEDCIITNGTLCNV